jgi:hypothetical protein
MAEQFLAQASRVLPPDVFEAWFSDSARQLLRDRVAASRPTDFQKFMTSALPIVVKAFLAWMIGGAVAGASSGGAAASESAATDIALGGQGGSAGGAAISSETGMLGTTAGGLGDTALQGALRGATSSVLSGGNPLTGALRGGLTGVAPAAIDYGVQSAFDTDINFADIFGPNERASGGMLGGGASEVEPDFFGGLWGMQPAYSTMAGTTYDPLTNAPQYSTPAMTTFTGEGMLSTSLPALGLPYDIGAQLTAGMSPAQITALDAENRTALEAGDMPAEPAPAAQPSSVGAHAARLAKLGATLAKMSAGQGAPEDAPQRTDEQSDAEYAQTLADYIQVDAAALAEMGLVPGTPEYYDYLMTQLDATIESMTGEIDVNAADLEQQLRSKTREEIVALRRVLFVRGQLDQLMGSGTYTDPFTGLAEEVITNGRQVNPGVAAYHRGLGRTVEEFSQLSPVRRKQAIGDFLGRDADLYGMQARSDARDEQAAQASAFLEDLKRRGMFSQSMFRQ